MKNNIGWKILSLFLALLLIAGAIVGVVFWQKGNIIFKPVEQTEQEQPAGDEETPDDGKDETADNGGAVIGEGESNGISLMSAKIATADYAANGISTMAETAYMLTATITPDNATYKAADWSVAFVNPESEWAMGKTVTDYVTVTSTADGALTANVECKQAFGEQIKVTVTSRENSNATANCMVDYIKRVTSFTADFSATELDFDTTYNVTFSPVYSEGTLQGTITSYTNADIQLTEGFKDAIEAKMKDGYVETLTYYDPANFTYDSEAQTFTFSTGSITSPFLAFAKSSAPKPTFNDPADKVTAVKVRDDFNNAFTLAAGEYGDTQAVFTVDYIYSYNDTQFSAGTVSVNLKFDAEALVIVVTGIKLNMDNIVF